MQPVERIDDILKRYEGQNVYVVIEVLSVDKRISKPLTGRLLGVTPDREEALLFAEPMNRLSHRLALIWQIFRSW